jgi:general secretion pathway protein C
MYTPVPRPFSPCLSCARYVLQHPIQIYIERNKMKRLPQITSFVLFIALCVSAAYWAMQLFKPPQRAVIQPPQASYSAPRLDAAAGLLGGRSSFAVASNFQLKGVVVASNPAESIAILSANGKPAQSIRINTEVVPGVSVKEVQKDYVLLSEGGAMKRVELPADARKK